MQTSNNGLHEKKKKVGCGESGRNRRNNAFWETGWQVPDPFRIRERNKRRRRKRRRKKKKRKTFMITVLPDLGFLTLPETISHTLVCKT